jgi:hypothetical protein
MQSAADVLPSVGALAGELESLTGPAVEPRHQATFRAILEDTLAKDAYLCRPLPRDVFFGRAPEGQRVIAGQMPHYDFFFGPMHYVIRRRDARPGAGASGETGGWEVELTVAVEPPASHARLELSDCKLEGNLEGEKTCRGIPYDNAESTDACPASGEFFAGATPHNVRTLLSFWSREAERYYNRDAESFGLPVRYDFEFLPAEAAAENGTRVDVVLPLWPTCGRTPYFTALRSGWSVPIVAHEMGHFLGLLDEYEALSGIFPFYPKTPFPGAGVSRMGLSMKTGSKVLPIHHYLILRRYFCAEPRAIDPYSHAFP